MTHKILYTFCLIVTIAIQIYSQESWVPFLQQTKSAPLVTMATSNNNNVSFSIQINGIVVSNMKIGTLTYQKISIPDGELMKNEGSPQVPVITKIIAIPDCDNVTISINPSNKLEFSNYNIIPAPKHQKQYSPDGSYFIADIFDENKSDYSSDNSFPGKNGEIIETGYIRGQKIAKVYIYPIQFTPISKKISVFTNFTVNLTFSNPKSAVNKELGIFSNMMHHAALNYVSDSLSASTKIIETTQSNGLSKATPKAVATSGSATWVTNLSTLVGTNAIPVDYLIITHSSLFSSAACSTLANYRANHNGFDVAVVQVSDIYNYESNNTYVGVRNYLADVFNLGKATHTGDGHLAYILLVGDAYLSDKSAIMVPAAYFYSGLEQASDYSYACLTQSGGTYDDYQDVMYGRLPVVSASELSNAVTNIINYETNQNGNWNNHFTFINSSPLLYSYSDPEMASMVNLVPNSFQKKYAFRAHTYSLPTYVTNVNPPIFGQWFTDAQMNSQSDCGAIALENWLYDDPVAGLNSGVHTFVYEDHGGWNAINAGEGSGRYIFKNDDPNDLLQNRINSNRQCTFMILNCCDAGHFDDGFAFPDHTHECIAETVLKLANKGAIGCVASTRDSDTGSFGWVDGNILNAMLNNLAQIMGEAVMESKLSMGTQYKHQFNLYGDPAVNLFPTGQTLNQNLTLSGDNYISSNITVPSGVALTISPGAKLQFSNGSKLIINGTLTANGGSASTPIRFNFISPNSNTQNGIVLNSGSNGTINYCKVVNACNGIYENSASINITNSAIDSCTYGIYLYSVNPSIHNNSINYNSYGIFLISSAPDIYSNYIQYNTAQGINCSSSSSPTVGNGYGLGNNIDQNNYGLFCWNSSYPNLGNSSSTGYNNLTNINYNVYNMSSNGIYAMYNWWGTTNTNNFKIAGEGSVVSSGYVNQANNVSTPPLSKAAVNMYTTNGSTIPLLDELNKAYQYIATNNMVQAREICFNLINNYPDYPISFNALNLLSATFTSDQVDSVKNIYSSIFGRIAKKKIYAMAGLILANFDKGNRLQHLNDVINNYGQDSVVELALFDKFVYYHFEKNDGQNALSILKLLDSSFPFGQADIEAHQILGDKDYYGKDASNKQSTSSFMVQTSIENKLFDNYPNPFNPSTIIEYQLPKDGVVTLKVYDILGKEVQTLTNEYKTAGKYSVSFDATKLASGIYFYQIRTGSFISTKKMLLVK